MQRIDDTLNTLPGSRWFSTLDLKSGYWQVEVYKRQYLPPSSSLYHFNVMPFGLCNASATFERLMELVLRELRWEMGLVYLNDIIWPHEEPERSYLNLPCPFTIKFKEVFILSRKSSFSRIHRPIYSNQKHSFDT